MYKRQGWGGLSDAFDPNKSAWSNEYSQLKAALSESEYEAARSSTLTAFYTPATVIHPIYRALERFGVKGGKILEPSMGTCLLYTSLFRRLKQHLPGSIRSVRLNCQPQIETPKRPPLI